MKRLVLLRHAKSSWTDPGQEDYDRPLNERGRLSAPLMAAWIAERGARPDHVLLSGARRTVETWERLAPVFGASLVPVVDRRLYMADPATMLAVLREQPAAETILLVGHQPGLSGLARKLSADGVPANCAEAFGKFPTAAVALFEVEADSWADLDWGKAKFRHFATPKDLV